MSPSENSLVLYSTNLMVSVNPSSLAGTAHARIDDLLGQDCSAKMPMWGFV